MNRVRIGRCTRPAALAGDKGYSSEGIRDWLRAHAIQAVIPRRKDQHPDDGRHRFDRALYRRRGVVEQCVGWLKECRRLGTRFEKLAVNFLAMIHLAFIERYLTGGVLRQNLDRGSPSATLGLTDSSRFPTGK